MERVAMMGVCALIRLIWYGCQGDEDRAIYCTGYGEVGGGVLPESLSTMALLRLQLLVLLSDDFVKWFHLSFQPSYL